MKTIDESPNATALAFIKMVTSVAEQLSGDELLYLSRSEEEVLKKLKMGDIEFLQEISEGAGVVSSCEEETLHSVWNRGQFRSMTRGQVPVSIEVLLKAKYEATPKRDVMPYRVICDLSMQEMQNFIEQDLSNSTFTPQQASKLMSAQNFRKRSGPLSFDENNFILIKDKEDKIAPMLIFWKKTKKYPFAKNAWDFWEQKSLSKGRLLLLV